MIAARRSAMSVYLNLLLGLLWRVLRSRDDLLMENLVLRQQLAVYARGPKRPRLGSEDRLFWSAMARIWHLGVCICSSCSPRQ
jgi:hypothetical protein